MLARVLARDCDDGLFDVEVEFVGVFGGERDAGGVGSFDEFGGLAGGGVEVGCRGGRGTWRRRRLRGRGRRVRRGTCGRR